MPMYNLIEYSNTYSKKSESLWQYYREDTSLRDDNIIDLLIRILLKSQIGDDGTSNVEKMVPLKYLSNF